MYLYACEANCNMNFLNRPKGCNYICIGYGIPIGNYCFYLIMFRCDKLSIALTFIMMLF